MRRRAAALALLTPLLAALGSTGCATPPLAAPAWRAPPGQALLLGEVHDNAAQHALRAQGLAALLAAGDRPALLMEQFDREHQSALDAALRTARSAGQTTPLDAQVDRLIAAGGPAPGWDWPLYRPYLRLALQHGLPVVAANVSRTDARRAIQQGLAAMGLDSQVPADIRAAQADAILQSHCGQVDAPLADQLALAQIARDQVMARLVTAHVARGVVLLGGNGHVRADIGVPRWLAPGVRAHTRVIGFLEAGDSTTVGAFDMQIATAAQPRPDPCAGLQMPPRR